MYKEDFKKYFSVAVYFDSHVRWSPGGAVSIKCPMDIKYFPFDTQKCKLLFECWMDPKERVLLQPNRNYNQAFLRTTHNGIWEIIHTLFVTKTNSYDTGDYSQMEFYIFLKRKSIYYFVYMVAPCAMHW